MKVRRVLYLMKRICSTKIMKCQHRVILMIGLWTINSSRSKTSPITTRCKATSLTRTEWRIIRQQTITPWQALSQFRITAALQILAMSKAKFLHQCIALGNSTNQRWTIELGTTTSQVELVLKIREATRTFTSRQVSYLIFVTLI